MSRLTIYLARSIGLFTVTVVAGMMLRGSAIIEATVSDAPLMLAYAIISLAIGIAMVVGHNVWSGGMLAVTVTLVGWLILAKGLLLLLLAPDAVFWMYAAMGYGEHQYSYLVPSLLIGIYLAWAGFTLSLPEKP